MYVTLVVRNRTTHVVRKIRKKYAEFDLMHISDILRNVMDGEAIIEIFINADSYL